MNQDTYCPYCSYCWQCVPVEFERSVRCSWCSTVVQAYILFYTQSSHCIRYFLSFYHAPRPFSLTLYLHSLSLSLSFTLHPNSEHRNLSSRRLLLFFLYLTQFFVTICRRRVIFPSLALLLYILMFFLSIGKLLAIQYSF